MTEYFRIEGKNDIKFDEGATGPYTLARGNPPRDMSRTLSRQEVIGELPRLPLGIRGHALNRGMSMATFPFNVQATTAAFTDAAMEQALHDLKETLNEAELYIESESARGTRAVVRYKSDGAAQNSYKTLYYGFLEDAGARQVLGAEIKNHRMEGLQLTLYMEPKWRPSVEVMLGPNEIYCPGFEEDENADGLADQWTALNAPVLSMERTIVLQGFYSQQVDTNADSEGLISTTMVAPAGTTQAIAYAWICRPTAGSDIKVQMWDTTAGASRGFALFSTAGWPTATAKNGTNIFKRVAVEVAAGIVARNNHVLRVFSDAATATTFYVDKCFWKWDVITIPDEWCDHWLIYNHYDTTEGAAHVGHQNYFDVADLKGTDEARLRLRIRHYVLGDYTTAAHLMAGRRSRWQYPSIVPARVRDVHWIEAEDATSLGNWASIGGLAACSAGNCIHNAANTSGDAEYQFVVTPPAAGQWCADYFRGRYDVFAVVYTDDPTNTQYRLGYRRGSEGWCYNRWVKQPNDLQWQMIYLGEINFDMFIRADLSLYTVYIIVEYAKQAANIARLDCLWLLDKNEPQTRLHVPDEMWVSDQYYWVLDRSGDFDYEQRESTTPTAVAALALQGDVMTLTPDMVVGQRIYFSCENGDMGPTPDEVVWQAHGAATNLQLRIYVAYVAQYQTPLD